VDLKRKYRSIRVTQALKGLAKEFGTIKTASILLNKYNGQNLTQEELEKVIDVGMQKTQDSIMMLDELKKKLDRLSR
jgi:hypothetical protein